MLRACAHRLRHTCKFVMAGNSEFRQQAVTTANLLLEAASLLETSQATGVASAQRQPILHPHSQHHQQSGRLSDSVGSGSHFSSSAGSSAGPAAGPSYRAASVGPSGSSQRSSVTAELRGLFN